MELTPQQARRKNIEKLKSRPCADCGKRYPPYVMDLDHVRGEKRFALANGHRKADERFHAEIDKCEVVCANCHRERTHQRRMARNGIGDPIGDASHVYAWSLDSLRQRLADTSTAVQP